MDNWQWRESELRNLGPIDIADNVYICSNVILYPNVKIGKNCLILDGSVITTSIEENSVVEWKSCKGNCVR